MLSLESLLIEELAFTLTKSFIKPEPPDFYALQKGSVIGVQSDESPEGRLIDFAACHRRHVFQSPMSAMESEGEIQLGLRTAGQWQRLRIQKANSHGIRPRATIT